MAVDYLYLESVRGPSVEEVGNAVTRALEKRGWRAGEPSQDVREIRIAALGDWIVVSDREAKELPGVWADVLSAALGGTGISARSWSDDGEIELQRFENGKKHGGLKSSFDEPTEGPIDLAFLADLAPLAARAKLEKPLKPKVGMPDETFRKILDLVGLPEPLDRYMELEAHLQLGFFRPVVVDAPDVQAAANVDLFAPDKPVSPARPFRRAKVTLERIFHLRAARADVVRAIRDELAQHGVRPRRRSSDGIDREIFVRDAAAWCSIGEKRFNVRPFLPGGIHWGEILSQRLQTPVLAADAELEYLALSVCIDGHEGASLDFPSCIRDEPYVATVDARTLAIFATSRSRAKLASIAVAKNDVYAPQRAMAKVAKALGLEDPLFAKAIDGVLLTFT